MNTHQNGAGADATFRKALAGGQFLLQLCDSCKRYVFYPRQLCPYCGKKVTHWMEATGRGVVYSATTVHRSAEQGGAYNVSIIQLEEGPKLMSCVAGATTDVAIGTPVKARITIEGEQPFLMFDQITDGK